MSIAVEFRLITPYETMLRRSHNIAEKRMNVKLKRAKLLLETKLPQLLEKAIKKSALYFELKENISFSMTNPTLLGALGIPDIMDRIDAIIKRWSEVKCEMIPFKFTESGCIGGIRCVAIKSDYSDVLSMPEATAVVGSVKGNSAVLPWLSWLLLGGTGYVVRDYIYYEDTEISPYSRTQRGIMEKRPGKGWEIPDIYKGSQEDNFLTNILDVKLEEISQEIFARIEKL